MGRPQDFENELMQLAREQSRRMSAADLEEQARNFAAGNAGLEDPRVTRETVDQAAPRSSHRP